MSDKLAEFKKLLTQKMKSKVPIQTEWVKVSTVDWDEKTMVAIGENNGLEYFDVLLGLGSINIRPKIDSLALVGAIHNGEGCFMISCEEIEEMEWADISGFKWSLNNGLLTMNGDQHGGIVIAPELVTQINKNTAVLEAIKTAFSSWAAVPNDGGAALKALSSAFVDLETADLSNIENSAIKHG
jgi:hypothetical protein